MGAGAVLVGLGLILLGSSLFAAALGIEASQSSNVSQLSSATCDVDAGAGLGRLGCEAILGLPTGSFFVVDLAFEPGLLTSLLFSLVTKSLACGTSRSPSRSAIAEELLNGAADAGVTAFDWESSKSPNSSSSSRSSSASNSTLESVGFFALTIGTFVHDSCDAWGKH